MNSAATSARSSKSRENKRSVASAFFAAAARFEGTSGAMASSEQDVVAAANRLTPRFVATEENARNRRKIAKQFSELLKLDLER